jgi:virulence factor Mce-like protein
MKISGVALAPDANATLRLKSMIGSRYIELGPVWSGKGPRLGNGDLIPRSRTQVPAEVSEFLDEAARVSDQLDEKALGSLVSEMAKAFAGRRDDVAALTSGLADIGGTLAGRAKELDASLLHLRDVTTTLAERDDDLVRLFKSSAAVSQALLAQQGALDGAVKGLDGMLGRLADFTANQKDKVLELADRLSSIGRILAAHEKGWQQIVDLGPYYGYGWSRAIYHDGTRWAFLEQPQGLAFVPFAPFMHPINDRGGPGSDVDDNTVYPNIDWSCSPARTVIPWQVDATGPTGPGPLIPEQNIGDGFITTNNDPGQAYTAPGYEGAPSESPPPAPSSSRCDTKPERKVP